jgi:hypothetical protein
MFTDAVLGFSEYQEELGRLQEQEDSGVNIQEKIAGLFTQAFIESRSALSDLIGQQIPIELIRVEDTANSMHRGVVLMAAIGQQGALPSRIHVDNYRIKKLNTLPDYLIYRERAISEFFFLELKEFKEPTTLALTFEQNVLTSNFREPNRWHIREVLDNILIGMKDRPGLLRCDEKMLKLNVNALNAHLLLTTPLPEFTREEI